MNHFEEITKTALGISDLLVGIKTVDDLHIVLGAVVDLWSYENGQDAHAVLGGLLEASDDMNNSFGSLADMIAEIA